MGFAQLPVFRGTNGSRSEHACHQWARTHRPFSCPRVTPLDQSVARKFYFQDCTFSILFAMSASRSASLMRPSCSRKLLPQLRHISGLNWFFTNPSQPTVFGFIVRSSSPRADDDAPPPSDFDMVPAAMRADLQRLGTRDNCRLRTANPFTAGTVHSGQSAHTVRDEDPGCCSTADSPVEAPGSDMRP